jgi:hypothetical protein
MVCLFLRKSGQSGYKNYRCKNYLSIFFHNNIIGTSGEKIYSLTPNLIMFEQFINPSLRNNH